MIFIDDKTSELSIKFPKNNYKFLTGYTLELVSQATNQVYVFTGLTDASGMTDYYTFNIDFSEVDNGEYEYKIGCDRGLIQIGNLAQGYTSYNNADKTFIEYKA